jgi:hypothetical protein
VSTRTQNDGSRGPATTFRGELVSSSPRLAALQFVWSGDGGVDYARTYGVTNVGAVASAALHPATRGD